MLKTCAYCFPVLVIVGLAAPAPVVGSSILYVQDFAYANGAGGAGTASTDQGSGLSATASTVVAGSGTTPACSDPNDCAVVSYAASARFGTVALSFNNYASCTYDVLSLCGPSTYGYHYAEANFAGDLNYSSDGLLIGAIPGGSGLLEVQYLMSGTISASGEYASGSIYGSVGDTANPNAVAFDVGLTVCPVLCNDPDTSPYFTNLVLANGSTMFASSSLDPNLSNTWDYSVWGTMIVSVSSFAVDSLQSRVDGSSDNPGSYVYGATNVFAASAVQQIGGAQVFDSTGATLLSGVGITSDSGYDYTQSIPGSSAPEPATLGLIAAGLVALAFRSKNRPLG